MKSRKSVGRRALAVVVTAGVLGVLLWFAFGRSDPERIRKETPSGAPQKVRAHRITMPQKTPDGERKTEKFRRSAKKEQKKPMPGPSRFGPRNAAEIDARKVRGLKPQATEGRESDDSRLSPEGKRLVGEIRSAYEADDWSSARKLVAQALVSPEPAVRSEMVWTLDWFGAKALPEIVGFLGDADKEVAAEAFGAWESSLRELDDSAERLKIVELVLTKGGPSEVLESAAHEYADIDDRPAIESLVRVISAGAPGAPQARERYELITGKPYTDAATAKAWMDDFAPLE